MLSLNGNTAPFMLYAYVRIKGIERKVSEHIADASTPIVDGPGSIMLQEVEEAALGKHLLRFGEVLREIEEDLYTNRVGYIPYY